MIALAISAIAAGRIISNTPPSTPNTTNIQTVESISDNKRPQA